MPKRPANVGGAHDIAPVINQNLRELNTQIDTLQRQITTLQQTVPIKHTLPLNFGTIAAHTLAFVFVPFPEATVTKAAFASPNGSLAVAAGGIAIWCAIPTNGRVTVFMLNADQASSITPGVVPWTIVVI